MGTFKPIAMRCTQEQFDAIRPKLEKIKEIKFELINGFKVNNYLTNNLGDHDYRISNIPNNSKTLHGRRAFEEWDEDKFLEYCGVEVGLPEKWYVKVTDENREILNDWRKSVCDKKWEDYIMKSGCRVIPERHDGSYCAYFDDEALIIPHYQEISTEQFIKYVLKDNKPKETNKMKTKVKVTEVLEIHAIACDGWKAIIANKYLDRIDSEQNIEFTKSEVEEMFKAATTEQKPVLERIFGKQEAIKWDEIKTGSKVMLQNSGHLIGILYHIDLKKPFDVVFYNTPHYINYEREFKKSGSYDKNCTFHQDGKYVLFSSYGKNDYITEVIEY